MKLGIKAKLSVRLYADEKLVADSDDSDLWGHVLAAMIKETAEERRREQAGDEAETPHPSDPDGVFEPRP